MTAYDLDAAPRRKLLQPLGELHQNAIFPLIHGSGIDRYPVDANPHRLCGTDLFPQMRRRQ
jgi:hypothetical protein